MSLQEIGHVDEAAMWIQLPASVPVRVVEERLRGKGLTLGPQPPSIFRGSVREWIEGRWAGRWVEGGRLASAVASLKVGLDDGSILRTIPAPRSAAGPSITQIFVGSEGRMGEVIWAVLRSRPLSKSMEDLAFQGAPADVARWLQVEAQRISPPHGAEIQGGKMASASLSFPKDTESERMRAEAAGATARALGLKKCETHGLLGRERPWEREVPSADWPDFLEALGEGERVLFTRIARESAVAVASEETGARLPDFMQRDRALADLEDRLVAILRPI